MTKMLEDTRGKHTMRNTSAFSVTDLMPKRRWQHTCQSAADTQAFPGISPLPLEFHSWILNVKRRNSIRPCYLTASQQESIFLQDCQRWAGGNTTAWPLKTRPRKLKFLSIISELFLHILMSFKIKFITYKFINTNQVEDQAIIIKYKILHYKYR